MLGVFAEFETNLRRERQMEGIAKAKERGAYRGRKPVIDAGQVRPGARTESARGESPTGIAKTLGIGRASVYRVLEPDTTMEVPNRDCSGKIEKDQ